MDNPTEGNYYQPYNPQDPAPAPPLRYYDGNQSFATLSLVMGILALVSMCCFPFISVPFAGLGILFSCLSKGKFTRPGTSKAGMAISASLLAILLTAGIVISAMLFSSPTGRSFIRDYIDLLTSDQITEQELYDFIDKYTGLFSDSGSGIYYEPDAPYDNGQDFYDDDFGDYLEDYYDYFNGGDGYPGYSSPDGGGYPDGYTDMPPGSGDNYI